MSKSLVDRLDEFHAAASNPVTNRILLEAAERIEELEASRDRWRSGYDGLWVRVLKAEAENARLREEKKTQANTVLAYQGRFGYTEFGEDLRRRAEEMVEELDDWSEGPDTYKLTTEAADLIRELAGLEVKDEM